VSVVVSRDRAALEEAPPSRLAIFLRSLSLGKVAGTLSLWLLVLIVIGPLAWAAISSFKPDVETSTYPPTILPHQVTIENYIKLFTVLPFTTFFINSLVVSVATSVLTILLSATAAYSTARFRSPFAEVTSAVGLVAYMLPGIVIVVPVFAVAQAIHALDSLPALVVIYTAYFVPFGVWQLRSYFAGIPIELEEAAMVDGASRLEAFYMVVVPQALPGLIATGIWTFTVAWNEYLFASLLLYTQEHQTLSIGLSTVLVSDNNLYSWGVLMAACTLMTVPVMVIFMVIQRSLVAGLSSGAVKG
jgi:ABC-type glycerol-3-phosphate transport system permease component